MKLKVLTGYLFLTKYVNGQSCVGTLLAKSFTNDQKTFTVLDNTGDAQIPGGNNDWSYWFTETESTCSISNCEDQRLYGADTYISTGTGVSY